MDRGSKIVLVIFGILIVSGSLAVYFFTEGSIIGQPGTSQPCDWTITQTESGENFTSFEELNQTLQDELGDDWERFYSGTEVRKNSETGLIEDRLEGDCKFSGGNQ
jgi:hypothetical protein